jgi:hypothetical protein
MREYKRLKKDRRKLLALPGLTPKECKVLLPAFCEGYERRRAGDPTPSGQARPRQVGGGRKGQVRSPEQTLLFMLV